MRKYLLVLLFQFGIALSVTYSNQFYTVPLAMLPIVLTDRSVLRILRRWKLVGFLVLMIFGVPLFVGDRSALFFGIPYSPEYFKISVVMGYRSIIILFSLKMFTNRIPLRELARRMQGGRFSKFGQVFSMASDLLPELRQVAVKTYTDYKGSGRDRNIVSHNFHWVTELIVRLLLTAEETHSKTTERTHHETR